RGVLAALPSQDRVRLHQAAIERPDLPLAMRFRLWRGAGEPERALAEAERALAAGADLALALEAAELARAEVPDAAAAWEVRAGGGATATEEWARRAMEAYTRAGHEVGRLRAAVVMTHALWAVQRHAEGERICREALAAATRLDLRLVQSELLRSLALLLLESGSWTESRSVE